MSVLRCVIPVVLGKLYKTVACIYIYIYIYKYIQTHRVMNTTILPLVAIYNIQLHVDSDGLHTGPKHVVVSYVSLLIVICCVHDCTKIYTRYSLYLMPVSEQHKI